MFVPWEAGTNQDVSVRLYPNYPAEPLASQLSVFLAERPIYFDYQGTTEHGWTGGHCALGYTENAAKWVFAEGFTGEGFEEWLCLFNDNSYTVRVAVTYYPEGGAAPIIKNHTILPNSRYTIFVNDDAGPNRTISTEIVSDHNIICERPIYFDYYGLTGGHDLMGFTP